MSRVIEKGIVYSSDDYARIVARPDKLEDVVLEIRTNLMPEGFDIETFKSLAAACLVHIMQTKPDKINFEANFFGASVGVESLVKATDAKKDAKSNN